MITFIIGLIVLFVGGALYGKFCEKVFGPDDRKTPAIAMEDGVDYVPMKNWKNSLINLLKILTKHTLIIWKECRKTLNGSLINLIIVIKTNLGKMQKMPCHGQYRRPTERLQPMQKHHQGLCMSLLLLLQQ